MRVQRRRLLPVLAALASCLAMATPAHSDSGTGGASTPPPPALRCALHVPPRSIAGQPVPLRLTLHNPGPRALGVLRWQTPFEGGWFAPFVSLSFEGQELPYQGAMMKRGAPTADDYVRVAARGTRRAAVDLAQAFDLSRPGRYTLTPRVRLLDVREDGAPAGAAMQEQALDCPVLQFELQRAAR
jgi:hypothetical protein